MSEDEVNFRAWLRSNHVTDQAIDALVAEGVPSQVVFRDFVEAEDIDGLAVPLVQKKVLKKLREGLVKQHEAAASPEEAVSSAPRDELQEYLEQRGVGQAGVEGVRRLGVTLPSTLVHLSDRQVRELHLPPAQTTLLLDHVIRPLRERQEREALQEAPLIRMEGVHLHVQNVTGSEVFGAKVVMQAREARQRAVSKAKLLANYSKSKFVPSSGYRKCLAVLDKVKAAVLTGGPGSGKTSAAMAVARTALDKGQRVLVVGRRDPGQPDDRPTELLTILGETEAAEETLVVVDDVFGAFRFQALAFQAWLEAFDEVLKLLRSDRALSWRFLFTSRFDALQVALPRLGRFSGTLFSRDKVVNLSLPEEIPSEERRAIFLKHAELAGQERSIEAALVEEIVSLPVNVVCGFPHACEVFFDFPHLQEDPVQFFKAPLQAIKCDLQEILRDAAAKTAALLLTLVEGSIDVTEREAIEAGIERLGKEAASPLLRSWPETQDVLDAARNLTHTYLSADGDRVGFRHQTFYDVFAFLVGSQHPRLVLEHCSMTFLYDRVVAQWAQPDDLKEGLSGADEENFCILISSSYRGLLAERFCKELQGGNLLLVCSHQALQELSFVAAILDRLRSRGCLDRVVHLDDITGHGCYLCCAAFRQGPELLRQSVQGVDPASFSTSEIHAAILACCMGDNLEVLKSLQELYPSVSPLDACLREEDKGRYPHKIFKGLLPFDAVLPANTSPPCADPVLPSSASRAVGADRTGVPTTENAPLSPEEGMRVLSQVGRIVKARTELLRKKEIGKALEVETFYLPLFFQSRARFFPGYLTPLPLAVHCGSRRVLKHLLSASTVAATLTDRDHLCLTVALSCLDDADLLSSLTECWPAATLPRSLQLSAWPGGPEEPSAIEREIQKHADTRWSPLHLAALFDAPGIVRALLEQPFSADIEARGDKTRATALGVAVVANRPACVEELLSLQAYVDAPDSSGNTPLMWAVIKGHEEIAVLLLGAGTDVNAVNADGDTALIYAARFDQVPILRLLLPTSDVNHVGEYGHTALMRAAFLGRAAALRQLLADDRVDVAVGTSDGKNALHLAAMMGHADCASLLLQKPRLDVNARAGYDGETALIMAARLGRLEVVRELVANPLTDPNVVGGLGSTALVEACFAGSPDVVRALLPFCDVNIPATNTPLMAACEDDSGEVVALLLSQPGLDPELTDILGNTALCRAAHDNRMAAARLLLPRCDVNSRGAFGRRPLVHAAYGAHVDMVQLLLTDPRVDINVKDDAGHTAFSAAVRSGHVDVVRLLLPLADVTMTSTPWQDPPLVTAAKPGRDDVVKLLLDDVRFDVNQKSLNGTTALMAAARCGHCSTVQLLLSDLRVDVNARNREGHTALEIAIEEGKVDVVRILLDDVRVDPSALTRSGRARVERVMANDHSELGKVLQADSRFHRLFQGLSSDGAGEFTDLSSQATKQKLLETQLLSLTNFRLDNFDSDKDLDELSDVLVSGFAAMFGGMGDTEKSSSGSGAGTSQTADASETTEQSSGASNKPPESVSATPEGAAGLGAINMDLVEETMQNLTSFLANFIEKVQQPREGEGKPSETQGQAVASRANSDTAETADESKSSAPDPESADGSMSASCRQTEGSPHDAEAQGTPPSESVQAVPTTTAAAAETAAGLQTLPSSDARVALPLRSETGSGQSRGVAQGETTSTTAPHGLLCAAAHNVLGTEDAGTGGSETLQTAGPHGQGGPGNSGEAGGDVSGEVAQSSSPDSNTDWIPLD